MPGTKVVWTKLNYWGKIYLDKATLRHRYTTSDVVNTSLLTIAKYQFLIRQWIFSNLVCKLFLSFIADANFTGFVYKSNMAAVLYEKGTAYPS